jgi:hypothetical protein
VVTAQPIGRPPRHPVHHAGRHVRQRRYPLRQPGGQPPTHRRSVHRHHTHLHRADLFSPGLLEGTGADRTTTATRASFTGGRVDRFHTAPRCRSNRRNGQHSTPELLGRVSSPAPAVPPSYTTRPRGWQLTQPRASLLLLGARARLPRRPDAVLAGAVALRAVRIRVSHHTPSSGTTGTQSFPLSASTISSEGSR